MSEIDYTTSKKRRAQYVLERLEDLYPETPVPLDHTNAFTLLVAVLLSAQCTDERVNQITPALFAKADNPFDMVKLTVEEIKEIIRPCGLSPRKSKAIWELSKILIEKHNGEVPEDRAALEALPGVGRKTANVVLNTAFGWPTIAVDTHIYRVSNRTKLAMGKNVEQVEEKLLKVVLIGQPELQQLLKRNELRQLAQRITARYHLLPLSSSEVGAYIGHRLGVADGDVSIFSKATIRSAFEITGGIPRVINLLCDRALTLTFTKQLPVVPQHIFIAAAEQILGEDVVNYSKTVRSISLFLLESFRHEF